MQIKGQNPQKKFELNKTIIGNVGFDLTSEKQLCSQLATPFEQDLQKGHPLNAVFPAGCTEYQFAYQKASSKLNDDAYIYTFYNVMQQKLQLSAGRSLMERGYKYHKMHKVWVRKKQKTFEYFNIQQWKHCQFTQSTNQQDYYTKQDFMQK